MPPRQVYGKRANKTAPSYANFLSLDSDDYSRVNAEKKPTKDGARGRPKKEKGVVDVQEVELQLEALNIRDECTQPRPQEQPKADQEKARRALQARDNNAETKKRNGRCIVEVRVERQTSRKKNKDPVAQSLKENDAATFELQVPALPEPPNTVKQEVQRKRQGKQPKMNVSSQLPTPEYSPSPDDIYTSYVSPLLGLCNRRHVTPFDQWAADLDPHFDIAKIAEASYGEVYRMSMKNAVIPGFTRADESVLKIIAIKSPPNAPLTTAPVRNSKRNAIAEETEAMRLRERKEKESWKSEVDGIRSEVQLLQHLTSIPGFTNFRDLLIVQGRPPPLFITAWKAFNAAKPRGEKSVFPDPSKKVSYAENQLWAVIEMQDAGTDLEKLIEEGAMGGIWEVWDVFWGVVLSVGKGEEGARFEHRDLHAGNICIRSTRPDSTPQEPCATKVLERKLGFTGLETTLIDYTLSRADLYNESQPPPPGIKLGDCKSMEEALQCAQAHTNVAYLDLDKDPALWQGDALEDYQYEIYRYMRSVAYFNDPLKQVPSPEAQIEDDGLRHSPRKAPRKEYHPPKDVWKRFHPKTNLVWLHLVLVKLLEYLQLPSQISVAEFLEKGCGIEGADPNAAVSKKIYKKAVRLEKIFRSVEAMLEPEELGKSDCLQSVGQLILVALGERWLDERDVVGGGSC